MRTNGPVGPLQPHKSWIAISRPFVNRDVLRAALEDFDAARPGADSVLVIEGAPKSGKTHSLRLAKMCAPPQRVTPINIKDWDVQSEVTAGDLAQAIAGADIVPAFDLTKEDAEGSRLLKWLIGRLRTLPNTWWLILDHCNISP